MRRKEKKQRKKTKQRRETTFIQMGRGVCGCVAYTTVQNFLIRAIRLVDKL